MSNTRKRKPVGGAVAKTKKPGLPYQELVHDVMKALDPDATVEYGKIVEGPDGKRDLDVSIRSQKDGTSHFVLIECKDWKNKVGINPVDALDSKRKDLGADVAMICSNSGFTEDAMKKAARVGIELVSALSIGDDRVRFAITYETTCKVLAVDAYSLEIQGVDRADARHFEDPHSPVEVNGLPLMNWLHEQSSGLMAQHEGLSKIKARYAFGNPTFFVINGAQVQVKGVILDLLISVRWALAPIEVDAAYALYDHHTRSMKIPSQYAARVQMDVNRLKYLDFSLGIPANRLISLENEKVEITIIKGIPAADSRGVPSFRHIFVDDQGNPPPLRVQAVDNTVR